MVDLLALDEAMSNSADVVNEPHLPLGSGFSISCRPAAFNYGALLDDATSRGATQRPALSSKSGNSLRRMEALQSCT